MNKISRDPLELGTEIIQGVDDLINLGKNSVNI